MSPFAPNIDIYPYEIKQANAEPYGAEEIALIAFVPPTFIIGLEGKNGARCFATHIGPAPGPPPPCGIAKVLCRLRWQTSAPIIFGVVIPT